jgi:hypothetical protein
MPVTDLHPLSEHVVFAHSSALNGSPGAAAFARVPFRGKVLKIGVVQSAAVTGTATVTTAINGAAITGGAVSVTGGSAGSHFFATPSGANDVNEDDVISFTPTGATGSATGHCYAVIRRA